MVLDSPYAIGIIFVTLALMWVLQMYLAKKQATSFLNAVNSIKGQNLEVAILFQGGIRVGPMAVENVYIVESHPFEALVAACHQVLARAPFSVGPRPHVVASFTGNHQFIAIGLEVLGKDPPEIGFSRTRRGTIIVGKIKVRNPEVKRTSEHLSHIFQRIDSTKVVPKS